MNFKQFLKESEYTVDSVLKLIKNECSTFLKETNNKCIFRGMNGVPGISFSNHPQGRKPRDSTNGFNFFYNSIVEMIYKKPKIRTYSIFATHDPKHAKDYGTLYFFFPVGKYEYLWVEGVEDSYADDNVMYEEYSNLLYKHFEVYIDADHLFGFIGSKFNSIDEFKNYKNKKDFILTYIEKNKSIFDRSDFQKIKSDPVRFYNEIITAMDSVGVTLFNTHNLNKAIDTNAEILFYKTDGYYSISLDEVRRYLRPNNPDVHSLSNEELYKELLTILKK